jgi:hypothetical protein
VVVAVLVFVRARLNLSAKLAADLKAVEKLRFWAPLRPYERRLTILIKWLDGWGKRNGWGDKPPV